MTRITIPVALRWSDIDAYEHVNNAELLRILEEARIAAFWDSGTADEKSAAVLDATPGAATATLVARLEIEYLQPISYRRDPLVIDLWISHLGGASIDLCYEVRQNTSPDSEVYARALTTMVMADGTTGIPRRITEAERAAWEPLLGDAPDFRRR